MTTAPSAAFLNDPSFLVPRLADPVSNSSPELSLGVPYDQVSEPIQAATFELLLDIETPRTPWPDPCWVRVCPEERIQQFLQPLNGYQLEAVLVSAARLNLPNVVNAAIQKRSTQGLKIPFAITQAWAYSLEYDHLDCLNALTRQPFIPSDQDLLGVAAWDGLLEAMKKLHNQETKWEWDWEPLLRLAAHKQHHSVLAWLLENCPSEAREAHLKETLVRQMIEAAQLRV